MSAFAFTRGYRCCPPRAAEAADPVESILPALRDAERAACKAGAVIELDDITWDHACECFLARGAAWDFRTTAELGRAMVAMGEALLTTGGDA